jgi:hypothetical protein
MTNSAAGKSDQSPEGRRALLERLLRQRAAQVRTTFPLSSGQQALWIMHQRAPESTAYNIALAARIRSRVDVQALRRALQAIVERHASLRTTYGLEDGEPVQVIHANTTVASTRSTRPAGMTPSCGAG